MEMTINLAALRRNADKIIKQSKTRLCAVVKCNAYGHGDAECAKALADKADCFAVADIYEANRLSLAGIKNDILILSGVFDGGVHPDNFIFTAFDDESLISLLHANRRFALKIDTGMHRLGFSPKQCANIFPLLPADRIHSVFSHIYDISSLKCQYEEFVALTKNFPVKKHIFASNFSSLADRLDYVRCGIVLYGYGALNLEKVMRLTADVISVRKVRGGDNVGYGICPVERAMNIATIDIGYGDGFRRKGKGETRTVLYAGGRCRVVGQICMDLSMIEAPYTIKKGQSVEILGEEFSAADIAKEWNTCEYEVLVSLGHCRAKRVYIN